jgi:hypothetical protein
MNPQKLKMRWDFQNPKKTSKSIDTHKWNETVEIVKWNKIGKRAKMGSHPKYSIEGIKWKVPSTSYFLNSKNKTSTPTQP